MVTKNQLGHSEYFHRALEENGDQNLKGTPIALAPAVTEANFTYYLSFQDVHSRPPLPNDFNNTDDPLRLADLYLTAHRLRDKVTKNALAEAVYKSVTASWEREDEGPDLPPFHFINRIYQEIPKEL